jgi:DNA-binding NtrC family response regulator
VVGRIRWTLATASRFDDSEPLFSLAENRAFLADLYYRLNVVRMDLTSSGERLG